MSDVITGRLPTHVAIFMDGNGRWAKKRGLPRTEGHKAGLEAAKRIVAAASQANIKYLTFYTFSTENWKRTTEEVQFLMGLVSKYLRAEFEFYKSNNVSVTFSGDFSGLSSDVQKALLDVKSDTINFSGTKVNLAINYGGRDEILRAVAKLAPGSKKLTEQELRSALDLPDWPDPDLIIRAGGEKRMSNFLMWESAYSELYFSDVLWPDWDDSHLKEALLDFSHRERRFGNAK